MHPQHKFLTTILLLLFISSSILQARTFTDAKGREIEAELVSHAGDNIVIKTNGKDFSLPITNFSSDDQEYIKQWIKDNPTAVDTDYDFAVHAKLKQVGQQGRIKGAAYDDSVKAKQQNYNILVVNKSTKPVDDISIRYEIYILDYVVMKNKEYSRMATTHQKVEKLEVIAGELTNQSFKAGGRVEFDRAFFTEFYHDRDGKKTGMTAEDKVIGMKVKVYKGKKQLTTFSSTIDSRRMSAMTWKDKKPGEQVR